MQCSLVSPSQLPISSNLHHHGHCPQNCFAASSKWPVPTSVLEPVPEPAAASSQPTSGAADSFVVLQLPSASHQPPVVTQQSMLQHSLSQTWPNPLKSPAIQPVSRVSSSVTQLLAALHSAVERCNTPIRVSANGTQQLQTPNARCDPSNNQLPTAILRSSPPADAPQELKAQRQLSTANASHCLSKRESQHLVSLLLVRDTKL